MLQVRDTNFFLAKIEPLGVWEVIGIFLGDGSLVCAFIQRYETEKYNHRMMSPILIQLYMSSPCSKHLHTDHKSIYLVLV